MSSSLLNLVDNLSEELHSDKCTDCKSCLDYTSVKDDQLIFRCFECKKSYKKEFNKELIKRFANIYMNFLMKTLIISLLKKGVHPYEYMESWERFYEISLSDKKTVYSSLNMENITNFDYTHANRVFKEFRLKNLGVYHDLYVQSGTLLLADVFENFRNMCIKVHNLDPVHFVAGLAWKTSFEKQE